MPTLKKQIESKQKVFDRSVQDAQEEFGNQQPGDCRAAFCKRWLRMIVKYAQENGFGMIIDTSKPWPQSPIVMAGEGVDITKPVVDIYNAQSGVAAPPTTGAAKPPAPKPGTGTGATKPARTQAELVAEAVKAGHLWCRKSSIRPRENAAFLFVAVRRGKAIRGVHSSKQISRGGHYVCR